MDVGCETDLRAVRDGLIGGGFAIVLVVMPALKLYPARTFERTIASCTPFVPLNWLSLVVSLLCFELAIASCTPLVPFVAILISIR